MSNRNGNYGDASRDSRLEGDYARDTHRGGLGDDYAREGAETPASDPLPDDAEDVEQQPLGKASE